MMYSGSTNNASTASNNPHAWFWLALLAVAGLRLWHLPEAGLPDYDSVRNWQVVCEMGQGNFRHLFHHGSPGFLLFYAPVAAFTTDFRVFQALNALLAVAGLGWFARWVARAEQLPSSLTAALVLLGGTSLLLTFSGRDFTMSSGALVLVTGLLSSYHRRLQQPSPAALLRAAGWLAAGSCFNYKFLFALPILAVLEWHRADNLLWRAGTWWRVLAVLAAPYLVLGLAGVLAGRPWYSWLAFYGRTVLPVASNAAGRRSTLHPDWFYYPRYLLAYETLLLPGLAAALLLWGSSLRRRGQALTISEFLLVWSGCLLAGMSLLIKAPRGLLFAYLPLAALAVLAGRKLLSPTFLSVLLAAAIGWNLWLLHQQIYSLLPSHYPQVATWLRTHQARRIASTVGLGLAPYLDAGQTLTAITDEHQLPALRRKGYDYVLLDSYWRVAHIPHFDSLRHQRPQAAWPEALLTAPLLFLEHSEFSGLDYEATQREAQAAAADSLQLRLYHLVN